MDKRNVFIIGLIAFLVASCTNLPLPFLNQQPSTSEATSSTPANISSPQAGVVTSPSAEFPQLNICAGTEPDDLFLYNDLSYIKSVILSLIYDGPIDMVDYELQPVILIKIPSMDNGDAVIDSAQVKENDLVMDDAGSLVKLHNGVVIRPAGCTNSACAVPFTGGTIQMDQVKVTFHIRPGVEWSDGAKVTAQDSIFSYKISSDPEVLYGINGLFSGNALSATATASYVALDDMTTQWTGLPGFLDSNYQSNFFVPLPMHQLSGYATTQLIIANEVLYAPLGWGPYRIVQWDHGQQIIFERNPHYFRLAEGMPFFNKVVLYFIGQDFENNMGRFSEGQCDIILQDAIPDIPPQTLQDVITSGKAALYLDPGNELEQITFNVMPPDNQSVNYFEDAHMRLAVAACINRNEIISDLFGSLVPPLDLALPADHPLLNGADISYKYNPQIGESLLEGLGWIDIDGDSIRESHGIPGIVDGTPLAFRLFSTDSPLRVQTSTIITEQLKTCGMQVDLIESSSREMFAQSSTAILSGRNFDLAEISSAMNVESFCDIGKTKNISSSDNGWSGMNLGGFSNPSFDAACEILEGNLPGTQEYQISSQTVIRLFSEGLPIFPLYYFSGFTLTRPDLTGIQTGFGQKSELQNIEYFRLSG